jgi:Holliday junction resolvase-like predicted endonuclease
VKTIVERDYKVYSGLILEKYFTQRLIESKQYSAIGKYWESGNANEIDIVAVNDFEKQITFFEVKRQKSKIELGVLVEKSQNIARRFEGYSINHIGLSMEDI